MTLFSAPHATKVLVLAVALVAGGMTTAKAGDGNFNSGWSNGNVSGYMVTRRDRHGRDGWRQRDRRSFDDRRTERHRDRHWRNKDRNFYGGSVAAYNDPGNGIYFYFDGDSYPRIVERPYAESRGPKVIHVVPGVSACSWESGVCVVRP